jgi:hypothetical protein
MMSANAVPVAVWNSSILVPIRASIITPAMRYRHREAARVDLAFRPASADQTECARRSHAFVSRACERL